jgi:MFS family permease
LFNFIHKNFNLLFFGFLIAFSSGFGQTFFISLFSNDFRATFNLSNTEFGSIYSIATVLSAITIIWAGKLIDTVNLKKYTLTIVFGMAIACLMASLAFNIFFLFLTIYFLRLFGQGLMGHTSRTTIARYFNTNRGKALAISGFGFYIGEMIYPIIIVFLILTIGWRLTWFSSSIFVFVILGLSFYFLLRNNNFKIEKNLNNNTELSTSIVEKKRCIKRY